MPSSNYDLLSWCVEYWFLQRELERAQQTGAFPADEPIDPMMFLALPGKSGRFPMWLSAEPRVKIMQLSKQGKCKDFAPSEWIGADEHDNYHGVMWLWMGDDRWALVRTAARSQRFHILLSEFVSEILTFELLREVENILSGHATTITAAEVDGTVRDYTNRFQMMTAAGLGRSKDAIDIPGIPRFVDDPA